MTTDTEPATAMEQATAVELARGIGRIEGQQVQTNERLREMTDRMDRMEARMDRLESKLDRLPWFGLTVIGGIVASMIVNYFVG